MVTAQGSILLFFYSKRIIEDEIGKKITSKEFAKMMNLSSQQVSGWAHGRILLTRVESYIKLSEITGLRIFALYKIAASQVVPEIVKEKKRIAEKRAAKGK